jgi:YidC/Oxa1 family membrane protein insertase
VEIRRLLLFVALSWLILLAYASVNKQLFPPPPVADQKAEPGAKEEPAAKAPDQNQEKQPQDQAQPAKQPPDQPVEAPKQARQRHALGSLVPQSKSTIVVYFDNRGAAIERVELVERKSNGKFKYRNLLKTSGYLGHLALSNETTGGCRINIVVPGSPAAKATSTETPGKGLAVGDVITGIGKTSIKTKQEFLVKAEEAKPGDTLQIQVQRNSDGKTVSLTFTATLTENPMELIAPKQQLSANSIANDGITPSFLLGLSKAGESDLTGTEREIAGLPSLRKGNWEVHFPKGKQPTIEFHFVIDEATAQAQGMAGGLKVVKRYTLANTYHVDLDISLHNQADKVQKLAYRLDGPNGLPLEGWWYSNKVHPKMFKVAGSRDVIWKKPKNGQQMHGAAAIHKNQKEEPNLPGTSVVDSGSKRPALDYIGVDTQYFAAIMLSQQSTKGEQRQPFDVRDAATFQVGAPDSVKGKNIRKINSSFFVVSRTYEIPVGKKKTTRYQLFLGPKHKKELKKYGLQSAIEYGWFSWVVKPMSTILHLFYAIVGNFGLAIVMLTIVVRGAMFPISRKATRGAQMMQFLSPEMKKIAEKYKNDMEKRSRAQRELFSKYNYNPFSGCLLMFFQLPVFIGLYRCLSVDIELRDAPLIPGMSWCSNLAAPDMFWQWESAVTWGMLTSREAGWLGPFFNILPIITIALFILQQKMFTPPATDDQTRMQQKMMKYMMLFMGILFFKVASGLCLYFIVSSAWGIAERKLLPKVGTPEEIAQKARERVIRSGKNQTERNGNARKQPNRKKKGKKKR